MQPQCSVCPQRRSSTRSDGSMASKHTAHWSSAISVASTRVCAAYVASGNGASCHDDCQPSCRAPASSSILVIVILSPSSPAVGAPRTPPAAPGSQRMGRDSTAVESRVTPASVSSARCSSARCSVAAWRGAVSRLVEDSITHTCRHATKGQGKHGNLLAEPLLLKRESHLRRLSLHLCAQVCVSLLAVAD